MSSSSVTKEIFNTSETNLDSSKRKNGLFTQKESRALTQILRHTAETEHGLKQQKAGTGFFAVSDLFQSSSIRKLIPIFKETDPQAQYKLLQSLVDSDGKNRFELLKDSETKQGWIRATQGHSQVEIDEKEAFTPLPLESISFEHVYHGTDVKNIPSILKSGLVRGERTHIHMTAVDIRKLSKQEQQTSKVSGFRASTNAMITIDIKRAAREGGLPFYQSKNGVVLCTGPIPSRFFSSVEVYERREGKWIPYEVKEMLVKTIPYYNVESRMKTEKPIDCLTFRGCTGILAYRSASDKVQILVVETKKGTLGFPKGGFDPKKDLKAGDELQANQMPEYDRTYCAFAAGALRECREETGLDLQTLFVQQHPPWCSEEYAERFLYFTILIPETSPVYHQPVQVLQDKKVVRVYWEEIHTLLKSPALLPARKDLLRTLFIEKIKPL